MDECYDCNRDVDGVLHNDVIVDDYRNEINEMFSSIFGDDVHIESVIMKGHPPSLIK